MQAKLVLGFHGWLLVDITFDLIHSNFIVGHSTRQHRQSSLASLQLIIFFITLQCCHDEIKDAAVFRKDMYFRLLHEVPPHYASLRYFYSTVSLLKQLSQMCNKFLVQLSCPLLVYMLLVRL